MNSFERTDAPEPRDQREIIAVGKKTQIQKAPEGLADWKLRNSEKNALYPACAFQRRSGKTKLHWHIRSGQTFLTFFQNWGKNALYSACASRKHRLQWRIAIDEPTALQAFITFFKGIRTDYPVRDIRELYARKDFLNQKSVFPLFQISHDLQKYESFENV